jgi:hypothetical protein
VRRTDPALHRAEDIAELDAIVASIRIDAPPPSPAPSR